MNKSSFDLIVVGGGAAGFFGAINSAQMKSGFRVLILEKSTKLLSKVKVSGGGRCNVTHHCFQPTPLSQHYPRGQKELKKIFRVFQASDMVKWCAERGVELKTEDDGRMFPVTDDSQTIIDCFLEQSRLLGIKIEMSCGVERIETRDGQLYVFTNNGKEFTTRNVLVASGGHNNTEAYAPIRALGHNIIATIPSLFTFNDSEKKFSDLMGVSVANAEVRIAGAKYSQEGPVLITHWGLSGPAVIKLSAWAAEYLHAQKYEFTALVNWTGGVSEEAMRSNLLQHRGEYGKRKIIGHPLFNIPQRLWERFIALSEIPEPRVWGEASNKDINRLIEFLIRCPFRIKGKTTFKEEFVSCGGVDMNEVALETMESKIIPGLHFAGEVLNIDGETGGFNFQSAWTTAFIAARAIAEKIN